MLELEFFVNKLLQLNLVRLQKFQKKKEGWDKQQMWLLEVQWQMIQQMSGLLWIRRYACLDFLIGLF